MHFIAATLWFWFVGNIAAIALSTALIFHVLGASMRLHFIAVVHWEMFHVVVFFVHRR